MISTVASSVGDILVRAIEQENKIKIINIKRKKVRLSAFIMT